MSQAYVNWGRWVIDCECKSAELLEGYPSAVRCKACKEIIQVEYPLNRRGIEAVLAHRPPTKAGSNYVYNHRNWKPGEIVADLQRENREHGLPDTEEAN